VSWRGKSSGISRRRFLGGAGAAIFLPYLESLGGIVRSAAAQDTPPLRLIFYYLPNGIHMPAWTPTRTGSDFELPLILEPLQNHRDNILVLSGLNNAPARPDGPGDHAAGTGSFLTATHVYKTEGADIENGISIDQVAANALGGETALPSVQIGIDGGTSVGGCDSGYSCAYSRNISWAGPQTPLPKMVNPQIVFDRFFGGFDPEASAAETNRRRRSRLSVLDYARSEANILSQQLASEDQIKLDEYLTGVRELERRVETQSEGISCLTPTIPDEMIDVQVHTALMTDLMVLGHQCDITRISTFMLGNASSGRVFDFLDIGAGHHDISHHQDMQENFRMLERIDRWEVEQLAYLLDRLDAVDEGEGTLLDNTLLFFSSEIADGNSHSHFGLPVLLAGGAGGALNTGRHIAYEGDPYDPESTNRISNLFISILGIAGIEVDTFGDDGTVALSGLSG
jgi:hypothetical protein